MNTMLRYLSCFECHSGNLLVCDPFSTDINADHYQLSTTNSCHICLPASTGVWKAYHLINKFGIPYAIYFHHSSVSPKEPENFISTWNNLGKVCVAFSHVVCLVDKVAYNKASYTYLSYSEDAIYDVDSIFEWLFTSELPEFKKEFFKQKLNQYSNIEFINGKELKEIFKDTNIGGISNIWSIDCKYRLHNAMKCSSIKNGFVAAAQDFSACFCPESEDLKNKKELIILIKDKIPYSNEMYYTFIKQ